MSVWTQTAAFGRARRLPGQIVRFLARLLQAGLVFRPANEFDLENGRSRRFEASHGRVSGFETRGEGPRGTM